MVTEPTNMVVFDGDMMGIQWIIIQMNSLLKNIHYLRDFHVFESIQWGVTLGDGILLAELPSGKLT